MMITKLSELEKYVANGMISTRSDSNGNTVCCYTKECFYGTDTWDDVTLNTRGSLFHNGFSVNKTFPKIFNVGEVESTKLEHVLEAMSKQPFAIMDKANGHLLVVSMFIDEHGKRQIVYSTKGSLPGKDNDLLNNDVKIIQEKFESKLWDYAESVPFIDITLCFEAIVQHDKHTMYEIQSKQYGEDTFVLLGGYTRAADSETKLAWSSIDRLYLEHIAEYVGLPVVKFHDDLTRYLVQLRSADMPSVRETLTSLHEQKGIEGYVIYFPALDWRVKIKTDEYWQLRALKEFTVDNLLRAFVKGGFRKLRADYPEEIANNIVELFHDWSDGYILSQLYDPETMEKYVFGNYTVDAEQFKLLRKDIFTNPVYNKLQRCYMLYVLQNVEDPIDRMCDIAEFRENVAADIKKSKEDIEDFKFCFNDIIASAGILDKQEE